MKNLKTLGIALFATLMVGCTNTNEDVPAVKTVFPAAPEKAVEEYFDEISKGLYKAELTDKCYGYAPAMDLEQRYDLAVEEGGDLPEEDNAIYELINKHWTNIEFKDILEVEKVNDYTVDVLVELNYQNLEQVFYDNKDVYVYNEGEYIDFIYGMIDAIDNPEYDYDNNIYVRLVNPVLMEEAGVTVDLPEVKDEWLVEDYYENDTLILLGNILDEELQKEAAAVPAEVVARVYGSTPRLDGAGNYLGWNIACEVKNNGQTLINEVVIGYDVILNNNIIDDRYLTFTNIGAGQYYNFETGHTIDENAQGITNVRIISVN